MPFARDVANELRKLADALDKEPKTEVAQPLFSFINNTKEKFMASARLLPRPLAKVIQQDFVALENPNHREEPIWYRSEVNRNLVCELVSPAVYKCEPLLSEAEEAALV